MDVTYMLLLTIGGGLRHVLEVYRQLEWLQLELIPGGGVLLNGIYVVGKGTNSVVFMCRPSIGSFLLVCKIRRGNSARPSLAGEGQFLHIANSVGVGPRLYVYSRDVVAYEHIDGVPLERWWDAARPGEKKKVIQQLLTQAYMLDKVGISHNELARLERHVLVKGDIPTVIDFESATLGGGNNVTQVANGLRRLGLKPPVEALRRYKRCLCEEEFRNVLLPFLSQL